MVPKNTLWWRSERARSSQGKVTWGACLWSAELRRRVAKMVLGDIGDLGRVLEGHGKRFGLFQKDHGSLVSETANCNEETD